MEMNRALQRQILEALRDAYPEAVNEFRLPGRREKDFQAHLHYLWEHKLITIKSHGSGRRPQLRSPRITALGLDLLEGDGGIAAIIETTTVRYHATEIRALFIEKIAASDLSEQEKQTLRHAVQSMSADALRQAMVELSGQALDRTPGTFRQLANVCREDIRQHG